VHARELELAVAAAGGSSSAIAELEQMFAPTIAAVCRRFARGGHTEDDLRQILREKLFVGEPDRPATIAHYNGEGSLDAWIRVTATRLFIDLGRRKDRARETAADPAELDPIEAGDLELDLIKAEYRGAIARALAEAARELEPGERHLLRQHLVGKLSVEQLAAVLGVHRATISRRLSRARDALIARTRELVKERLRLDDRELTELFGLVISKLDVSLRRMLETPT
jgi:RNA polymerase sigma-70 factor (ECF subfamily)